MVLPKNRTGPRNNTPEKRKRKKKLVAFIQAGIEIRNPNTGKVPVGLLGCNSDMKEISTEDPKIIFKNIFLCVFLLLDSHHFTL